MDISLPLDKMTSLAKIAVMEKLWDDLCRERFAQWFYLLPRVRGVEGHFLYCPFWDQKVQYRT